MRTIVVVQEWDNSKPDDGHKLYAIPCTSDLAAHNRALHLLEEVTGFNMVILSDPDRCEAKAVAKRMEVCVNRVDGEYWAYGGPGKNYLILTLDEGGVGVAQGFCTSDRANFLFHVPMQEDEWTGQGDVDVFLTKDTPVGERVEGHKATDEEWEKYFKEDGDGT